MTFHQHAPARVIRNSTESDETIRATAYAKDLAISLWNRCYRKQAPDWKPLDDLYGLLTQIDNMVCGMVKA